MCHSNLELELKPGLNVINGENGSGKSAILTAIQVCLGAASKKTNRGDSLKDLIQTGKEYVLILLKIHIFQFCTNNSSFIQ